MLNLDELVNSIEQAAIWDANTQASFCYNIMLQVCSYKLDFASQVCE